MCVVINKEPFFLVVNLQLGHGIIKLDSQPPAVCSEFPGCLMATFQYFTILVIM